MNNLYDVIEVCTDSDFDDYDFVRVNENHVALVIQGNGGEWKDYKVLFRHIGELTQDVDEQPKHRYQLEIQKRGVRPDNYSQSLIKKSKFASTVMFDDSPNFDSMHTFDIDVPTSIKLEGEADFVDGRVIVMITGSCAVDKEQDTIDRSCSLTDLVESILNKEPVAPAEDESPWKWKTTESYWLDGKDVSKEEFEKHVGKDYWKNFEQQFKDLDKQFETMNDTFKNLNDIWKIGSSSFKL